MKFSNVLGDKRFIVLLSIKGFIHIIQGLYINYSFIPIKVKKQKKNTKRVYFGCRI